MAESLEIVRKYYESFDNHDFAGARSLMHDRFQFNGPMMEASSPEELFAKMKDFNCDFRNRIVHIVEHDDTVGVLLDCDFIRPFSATIRMSEWFVIKGEKIASSTLVFDTRQMPPMTAS